MPTIQEVRAKYPQYNDMTDEQLASSLHRKFYADMPFEEFASKIGLQPGKAAAGQQPPEMSWGDTGIDMLKSGATGVVQGAIGLATMPQDLGRWLGKNAVYGMERLMGSSPEEAQARIDRADNVQSRLGGWPTLTPPSYDDVISGIESKFGPMYKPKTVPGEYSNTVGQFAAGALAGPGGVARKAALTVVPGVVSEAAGQATKGSEFEPYARIGGALLGGVAASAGSKAGTSQMRENAPSLEKVRTDKKAAYDALDKGGIIFDGNAFKSMAMKAQNQLRKEGLLPEQGGEVAGILKQIMTRVNKINGWTEVDSIRKTLGEIASNRAPEMATEARRAGIIINYIDDLVDNGAVRSVRGIKRGDIPAMVDTARDLGRRNILGNRIERMKSNLPGYVSGDESGFRNQFGSYIRSSDGQRLSKAEKAAFAKVVRREGLLNVANNMSSRLGQIAGGASGSTVGALIGSSFGPLGTGLGAIAGAGTQIGIQSLARKFMQVATEKSVDEAMKTVLAGRSAQEKAAILNAVSQNTGRFQTLMATDSGRRSSQEPFLIDAQGRQYAPTGALLGR